MTNLYLRACSPKPLLHTIRKRRFEAKQKELEGVVNPIMMKVYQAAGGGGDTAAAARSSVKARITLRRLWFGKSIVLSSLAPVFGEVSLVRSHSVMAARS
mgnify:CR=1 FL=1